MHLKHWMKVYLGVGAAYAAYGWYKTKSLDVGTVAKDVLAWPLRLTGVL